MTVAKVQSKWLPIFEHFHLGLTIPTFVFALHIGPLQLIKSHPWCHNIHCVVSFFEAEDTEWLTVFCGSLQRVYILYPIFRKIPVDEIPWNIFWPIPVLLDDNASIHSLRREWNNPICNTKTTFHRNKFAHRKERLVYPKHDSNGSSKLRVKLWSQLFWSILPLNNMCPPQNRGKPTKYCMALISKRIFFARQTWTQGKFYCTTPSRSRQSHLSNMGWTRPPWFFSRPLPSASYEIIHPHTALHCLYTQGRQGFHQSNGETCIRSNEKGLLYTLLSV